MNISAKPALVQDILPMRELYRQEMNCQIVSDSFHSREGWTQPYLLHAGDAIAGYGSIVLDGPWKGKPTLFEAHVLPHHRSRVFEFVEALLSVSGATHIETQSNGGLLAVLLPAFASPVTCEAILFHDRIETSLAPPGATFCRAEEEWVVKVEGAIAASGGVLWHYNPPYGDIYMEVSETFRRRGYGSYLVQELKRVCREHGGIPSARCNLDNIASRKTLQKAGFVPCGHRLGGPVRLT